MILALRFVMIMLTFVLSFLTGLAMIGLNLSVLVIPVVILTCILIAAGAERVCEILETLMGAE